MSSSFIPKAFPSLSPSRRSTITNPSLYISCKQNQSQNFNSKQAKTAICLESIRNFCIKQSGLAIQVGTILATIAEPAFAVTGENNEEDLIWVLIQLGISAFLYFIVAPPIILNWLRLRWYRRNFFEMYLQFMFVFMFYPGILLWAPFLNFRKFPRDPDMRYPWSTPQDPSKIKGGFLKYPWAKPEDYE